MPALKPCTNSLSLSELLELSEYTDFDLFLDLDLDFFFLSFDKDFFPVRPRDLLRPGDL
jgi:hypothetical protein